MYWNFPKGGAQVKRSSLIIFLLVAVRFGGGGGYLDYISFGSFWLKKCKKGIDFKQ